MAESPEDKAQEELAANVIDAVERFTTKNTPNMNEQGMIPYVFANDKRNPAPFGLLDMFYAGVSTNTVGIMVAKDKVTGNEVPILVGLSKTEGDEQPSVFPLAVIIGELDTGRYLPPDGKGGYVDLR